MTDFAEPDTVRILVATDNHVGFEERDAIRKDDSWQTFDEIINVARAQEVDMVLLAGDLFHENKPSRKSLYQVMRTLRQNCLGMKPCPLEFLSDAAEIFEGAFTHVNYEDPDINISIPVFSIHGNHDDPSGDGNFCSLDLLQASGLINYFGRVAEADNIEAKPILLRKGSTKLALYGLSNVRDERMFRTFRDHHVKWFRPGTQTGDWFNVLAVHQNHHAHTATSYLPENVLPEWLNLVVWGHEHECLIDPKRNPETGFHVMQPGSSVATSLVPGEAVQKHIAIVSISGKDFKVDKIPLKTVRPFITREIVLAQDKRFKGLHKKKENKQEVTRRLTEVVDEMIDEANAEWEALQTDEEALEERPLPLIRLKVEYSAPEGGQFECENPQRFSNRFVNRVANTKDVVFFYRKKSAQRKDTTTTLGQVADAVADANDKIKVETLVQEFLSAQSFKVFPQGPFGDAVNQFTAKDDKHAMELFVSEHLDGQVLQLLGLESENQDLTAAMEEYCKRLERQAASGAASASNQASGRKRVLRPKPDMWDSDFDGNWEDEPDAWTFEDEPILGSKTSTAQTKRKPRRTESEMPVDVDVDMDMDDDDDAPPPAPKPTRKTAPTTTRGKASKPPARKPPARKPTARTRARKEPESDEDDVILETDEDEPPPPPRTRAAATTTRRAGAAPMRQTRISFSQRSTRQGRASDDEVSDDDAFEPAPVQGRKKR
ncbi:hypothetical protein CDD82_2039 [Ophiocordyceps australis]|uniref:Double-strand break repair protein n=1 Tax=Ophiocordyceps australis TaxID=1399860 RepID=A0A2C5ZJF3_9HYPO|nr:hypothetical protein CDD82_2039 [Ophiocordyceps australis]